MSYEIDSGLDSCVSSAFACFFKIIRREECIGHESVSAN
jgi:hypothetical protein